MFVKNLNDCREFTAIDGSLIRELLHPKNDPVDLAFSLAVARVPAGERTRRHKLIQTEVYFILAGEGRMHIDNETRDVGADDVILIPPQAVQWIENVGNSELEFIAVVSPPWREEDDRQV
ncbi:MAG: cupin domain-containing protein [Gammaproteobacteria bacterium]